MNILDRILSWAVHRRGFVLGPGVIEWGDEAWGHDQTVFAPSEYGDYLATSSAVYTCSTLRASLLKSLPLKLYRYNRKGEEVEVTRGPLVDLLRKVNPHWTWGRLIEMTELSLCLWGEAFWFLERGASSAGEPKEIWWGRPDRVSVVPDPVNYIKGFLYEPLTGARDIAFLPSEVIWFRYANPVDEYSGLAPLAAARAAADYGTKGLRANNRLFDQGYQIGGIVMPNPSTSPLKELTTDQAKELDAYFERRFKGQDRAHRWATLRHNYEIWQGGISPKDAEFLGGLAWSLEEVARDYKIPLDLIGGQRTYANVESALKALWMHCLIPEADFLAEEITEQFLPMFPAQPGDLVKFDHSGVQVLQEAEDARWGREKEQIAIGALLVNEWRKERGKLPVAWGDVWWASSSLRPIEDAQKLLSMQDQAKQMLSQAGQPGTEEGGKQSPDQLGADQQQGANEEQSAEDAPERVYAPALRDVRARQAASVVARLSLGQAEPFVYAQWVKAYRVALRAAGASEREAQRLATALNIQAYADLQTLDRSIEVTELRRLILAILEGSYERESLHS